MYLRVTSKSTVVWDLMQWNHSYQIGMEKLNIKQDFFFKYRRAEV